MKKRVGTNLDRAMVDIWQREVGRLSGRNFKDRLAASEDLVLQLGIYRKLEKHSGCVNTVNFNDDGDILVSGSDDMRILLWDWEKGDVKLSFLSGHLDNVFQAKFMPYTNDRSIVTCAAEGQVRHAQVLERGKVETSLITKHEGLVHKLAIEPGSSHIFYTCGEDGLVQHIDLRTGVSTKLFSSAGLYENSVLFQQFVSLKSIAIDPRNPNFFVVAGSDEYTRLFDIRKCKLDGSTDIGKPVDYFCPPHLVGDGRMEITGLAFSDQSEILVSYNNECIYLFSRDMGLGPNPVPPSPSIESMVSDTSETEPDRLSASPSIVDAGVVTPLSYKGHKNCLTVKGVGFFGPKCEYVVSGSDCGRIFIWRKKDGELIRVMEADKRVVNCIESHPHSTVLASSGIEKDIKIWTPNAIERATLPINIDQDCWLALGGIDEYGDYIFDDLDDESDDDDDDDNDNSIDEDDEDEDDFDDYFDDDDPEAIESDNDDTDGDGNDSDDLDDDESDDADLDGKNNYDSNNSGSCNGGNNDVQ